MSKVALKGRVLLLHGFTQSSSLFYAKTLALRKKLAGLGYVSVYLNGPKVLTPAQLPSSDILSKFSSVENSEGLNYRGWWLRNADNSYLAEEGIETVKRYVLEGYIVPGSPEDEKLKLAQQEENGNISELPIVGLVGFSQGAALISLMVDQFEKLCGVPIQWAVLYSGFKVDTKLMPHYNKYYTQDLGESTSAKLLHVVGELDTVVGEDKALTFYEASPKNSDLFKHPGGHFVPNSKTMVDRVVSWIEAPASTDAKKPAEDSVDDLLSMMDKLGG